MLIGRLLSSLWWRLSLRSIFFSCRNISSSIHGESGTFRKIGFAAYTQMFKLVWWKESSIAKTSVKTSLVPRPARAIRVTRGGLEPSAIEWGLAKNDKKKSQIISRRKSSVFCDDHGIFRAHEINTSLPTICGPFHLIATESGGLFPPKTLVS